MSDQDQDQQKSIELLLKVITAAQKGDPQALDVLSKHRDGFKQAFPILEDHLHNAVKDMPPDRNPETKYKPGDGVDMLLKNMRDLVFSDPEDTPIEDIEVQHVPPPPPKPERMERLKVVGRKTVGNEPDPGRIAMPNTVMDPYGHPIDNPSDQTGPLDKFEDVARRMEQGQKKKDYLKGRYAIAAKPQVHQLVDEGDTLDPKAAEADPNKAMALQLLKTIFTMSGKPVK